MKAAVLHKVGEPFRIEEIPKPNIGPEDVLVETHTCGLCRTDVHIQDGLGYVPGLPHILGHEPAGVIVEVGGNVTALHPGQRVAPYLFVTCGSCAYCRTGRQAQCSNVKNIIGVTLPGGFAEYFKAPATNLLVLPEGVSFEAGGLVSCAVITAVHAFRRSHISVTETAVVLGAGGIGQILIQLLKAAGARAVAVDRQPEKLSLAQKNGANLALTPDVAVDRIREFTGGEGAECVFELVGISASMKSAADYVRKGGRIIVIGEEAECPGINTIQIAQRELEIIGSRNGSLQDAVDALRMMADGIVRPAIARRFPLDEFNEAMEFMRSGRATGRVVITIRE